MDRTNKSLRIGLVLDTSLDPPDGVQQYVVTLGKWLRQQGHDVHYLVGQTSQRDLPNIHSMARNISVRFNGNRTTIPLPTSKRKLRQFLNQNHFDVLHVQVPHSPFMAQRLIMTANPKTAVIGTFHVLPYRWLTRVGNRLLGIWLRPSLKRFDQMLAVSTAAQTFAKASFGVRSEVVPNAFDYNLFHQAQAFEKYHDGKINVLFLGRLVPRKGAETLISAVSQLNSEQKVAIRVIICGKGPLETRLKQLVDANNLKDFVIFEGFVFEADKPRYYASADIAVFPSSAGESFGIVLLEAMASGKSAVLAGNNPGYATVMQSKPELLFDPHDVAALTAKLGNLIENQDMRNKLANWAALHSKEFDISVVGTKILSIYYQALRKRSGL